MSKTCQIKYVADLLAHSLVSNMFLNDYQNHFILIAVQVESLLIKNYEEHVNAILSHVEAPLAEANKEAVLKKVIKNDQFNVTFLAQDKLVLKESN